MELFGLTRLPSGELLAATRHMTRAVLGHGISAGKPKKLLEPLRDVHKQARDFKGIEKVNGEVMIIDLWRERTQHRQRRRSENMKNLLISTVAMLMVGAASLMTVAAVTRTMNEAEIRALERRFAAAVTAKDVDKIMQNYVPDESLFVFDVAPPRQYVGAKAYRKDWEDFFAAYPGPVDMFDVTDLGIVSDGNLAFAHSIQHLVVTDKNGKKTDLTARVTDGYRKINGKWLIVLEHISVPVDINTGKADLSAKP